MARINDISGSAVPGQADAQKNLNEQKRQTPQGAVPGMLDAQGKADQEAAANSVFSGGKGRRGKKDELGPDYGRRHIRIHKADEVNPYADAEDARMALDDRLKKVFALIAALVVVYIVALLTPTGLVNPIVHPTGLSFAEFLDEVTQQAAGVLATFTGGETFFSDYVWEMTAALLAGAAMGLSGGVYQGALKNALASPSTLGVTSGGTIGLIIYLLVFYGNGSDTSSPYFVDAVSNSSFQQWFVDTFGMFISSMLGCLLVVLVIMLIATIAGRGHVSNVSLVIAGQVFTQAVAIVINVIEYYLIYVAGNETLGEAVQSASSVTFSGTYTALTVGVFAIPMIACFVYIFTHSGKLTLLAFNDEEARSMGISTTRTRYTMVAVCTMMTALVISFTGPIGFVGFLVPHIARNLIGPEFKYLLPATALLGAILVLFVHTVSYLGIPGFAVGSTGQFTSIIGCIAFVVIALRSRGGKNAEWF